MTKLNNTYRDQLYIVVSSTSRLSYAISKSVNNVKFFGRANDYGFADWEQSGDLTRMEDIYELGNSLKRFINKNVNYKKINLVLLQGVSTKDWLQSVLVNQISVGILSEVFCEEMTKLKIRGNIVMFGSAASYLGGKLPYSSSKASLIGMMNAINSKYGHLVNANLIVPGAFEGRMVDDWDVAKKRKVSEKTFAKRLATNDEIVNAIIFTCENDYLVGDILNLSSGQVQV